MLVGPAMQRFDELKVGDKVKALVPKSRWSSRCERQAIRP